MLRVRKAQRKDAKAAWDIRKTAILSQCPSHYSAEELQIWTNGELSEEFADAVEKHFYVAVFTGQVVGTGMVNLETGKIDAMFVHPNHIRTGVGRKIIEHPESLALEHGLGELHLESTLNAAPFYRSCGFSGNGVGEYASPRGVTLDCVPMVKQLMHNKSLQQTR